MIETIVQRHVDECPANTSVATPPVLLRVLDLCELYGSTLDMIFWEVIRSRVTVYY